MEPRAPRASKTKEKKRKLKKKAKLKKKKKLLARVQHAPKGRLRHEGPAPDTQARVGEIFFCFKVPALNIFILFIYILVPKVLENYEIAQFFLKKIHSNP